MDILCEAPVNEAMSHSWLQEAAGTTKPEVWTLEQQHGHCENVELILTERWWHWRAGPTEVIPDDLKSERASGLLCPDYKLGAGMEAERSIGKLDNIQVLWRKQNQ